MRNYNDIPDSWLLNEDITVTDILYLAVAQGAYTKYENLIKDKIMEQSRKK